MQCSINPPTASQIAVHVLALIYQLTGASASCAWESFVEQTHRVINGTVNCLEQMLLRPSTVAMGSILVSTDSFGDSFRRPFVMQSILFIMKMFNFDSSLNHFWASGDKATSVARCGARDAAVEPEFSNTTTITTTI